jgi:hypothetical protein
MGLLFSPCSSHSLQSNHYSHPSSDATNNFFIPTSSIKISHPSSLYRNTSKSFHIYYLDFDFVSISKLHFSALHIKTDLKIYL